MGKVTLTFDNGPEPGVTEHVLDVLGRRGVRATFFVVGEKLLDPARRALAERARREGHWLGNHTFTHTVPLGLRADADAPAQEIARTQAALGALVHPDRLFRPFGEGGHLDTRLLSAAAVEHLLRGLHTCVLWSCVPGDWRDPEGWAARALADCRLRAWSLVVLHDLPTGAMRHLDHFLDGLAEMGAEIVQDFPPDCVPIRRGRVVLPLARVVAGWPASADRDMHAVRAE